MSKLDCYLCHGVFDSGACIEAIVNGELYNFCKRCADQLHIHVNPNDPDALPNINTPLYELTRD